MARRQGVDLVPYQAEIKPDKSNQRGPVGTTTGSLLEWQGYGKVGEESPGIEWRKNEPFTATLTVDSTYRGRSAARFLWKDEQGRVFPMFLTDVLETLRRGVAEGGSVTGTWMVAKRGANYGIRLADLVQANDKRAASRALLGNVPPDWTWVGTKAGTVRHLVEPERLQHGLYGDLYSLCFKADRPLDGWVTGGKVDKRRGCNECTVRFNYRFSQERV